jgi:hypothetical protein
MPVITMNNKFKKIYKIKTNTWYTYAGKELTGDTHKTGFIIFIGLIGHEATVVSVDGWDYREGFERISVGQILYQYIFFLEH